MIDIIQVEPIVVEFGKGMVGVYTAGTAGSGYDNEVAFSLHETPHEIGAPVPDCVGKSTDDMACFLRFKFLNPESVQVLIDALIDVQESMLRHAKELEHA